jgi:transitional endoplasmic reticulum ATPase
MVIVMANDSTNVFSLAADEADVRDEGRCIARIPQEYMDALHMEAGEVLGIKGTRETCARVMPLPAEASGRPLIRMDGLVMLNARVKAGDEVTVFKPKAGRCSRIAAAPAAPGISAADRPDDRQVRNALINHCVCTGDHFSVRRPGAGRAVFVITASYPEGFSVVDGNTRVVLLDNKNMKEEAFTSYKDIGGLDRQITRIKEIVEYPMKYGKLFGALKLEPARGILLYGPPGTGKTLIARAIANEVNAWFITINGPEIVNKYYGESEAKLRDIFGDAEKHAPSIIFIDEIDAIAPKRDEVQGDVEKRIVAQLLSLMDGVKDRNGVVVIGATNLPNSLDPALRRPGRFDREIYVGVPDEGARYDILKIHTRYVPLAGDVDLLHIAHVTHGFVGADLKALCAEASMNCIRRLLQTDSEEIEGGPEGFENIQVLNDDFIKALDAVQPSAIREVTAEIPHVTWDMVGGLDEIKTKLREYIEWPAKYPAAYAEMDLKRPKGILLFGPPGTGKTLVARAVATESGCNFIPVKGPELLSKWQGETEKGVREVFRKARLTAPSIVFLDEIDSLVACGEYRERGGSTILAQLLTEMDGIDYCGNVTVIGATNRIEAIDRALLRDGRFDELLEFRLPGEEERREIFKLYLEKRRISCDMDYDRLARLSDGYSGAEIEGVCKKASLSAIRSFVREHGGEGGLEHLRIRQFDMEALLMSDRRMKT